MLGGTAGRSEGAVGAKVTLNEELAAIYDEVVDVVALDEALAQLAESYPQHARITEMRFFAGLTIEGVRCSPGHVDTNGGPALALRAGVALQSPLR